VTSGNRLDDEPGLVAECLAGNRDAFAELLSRYQKPVYNVAFRMVGNREDARDVTQSVFARAFEKLSGFDPERRFFSWIYRIAVHESLDLLQRRRRGDGATGVEAPEPPDLRTPEVDVFGDERTRRVQRAVRGLDRNHRAVVILRHFQQCSYREMAEILEIPEKTVKSRLFEARRLLRDRLAGDGTS